MDCYSLHRPKTPKQINHLIANTTMRKLGLPVADMHCRPSCNRPRGQSCVKSCSLFPRHGKLAFSHCMRFSCNARTMPMLTGQQCLLTSCIMDVIFCLAISTNLLPPVPRKHATQTLLHATFRCQPDWAILRKRHDAITAQPLGAAEKIGASQN